MENSNHGFFQPDHGFHWNLSSSPAPMPLPNQWNMQQMSPSCPPSEFIPVTTHYEPDNRFMQTIHHQTPQFPTMNYDPQFNSSFQNLNQGPLMINQNPHQFGAVCHTNPMLMNSYPINQEVNLNSSDYTNTNQFVPFFKPQLVIEQQQPPPLIQTPQTTYLDTPQDSSRMFVPDFVRSPIPLPHSVQPITTFHDNDTATNDSDMPYTLTTPCSPKTSNTPSNHHDAVRPSKLMQRLNIKKHEESAKKALLLKKKELKWKLMEASQARNREKLEEIIAEADYNKKKMIKIAALASKLRNKFIKVAMASKLAESSYKKVEMRLLTQEKFVADEKMQLAKLAVDCKNIGHQLYGKDYVLASNFNSPKSKEKKLALKIKEAKSALSDRMIELEKKALIHSSAKKLVASARAQAITQKALEAKQLPSTRLSPLYDLKNSLLKNLASYRLTTKFAETGIPITDLIYTHNICANCNICLPDLIGTCTDKNCLYQHKSNYVMTDIDKLADILSYKPSLTGFKTNPEQNEEENESQCRLKLKQYAAKLLARNSDKPVETIAQNLVKYVRANRSDHELLVATRELPKTGHLVCNIPEEPIIVDETNSVGSDEVSIVEPEEVSIAESDNVFVEINEDQ